MNIGTDTGSTGGIDDSSSDIDSDSTDVHASNAPGDLGVLVIIPTYNESENVERIVERLHLAVPDVDVLIVDDASPDDTGALAAAMAEDDKRVHVLHRTGKAGLGAAYVAGFDWGIGHGYDVLVEMDADGSHAPEQLPRLLAALSSADLVLGSRWVPGGAVVNWPRRREVLSRGGNLYTRLALGIDLHDATGGFRAYRREVLTGIDYAAVVSQGYCFQVDLAWRAVCRGYRVVEVPITFAERELGESKMSGAIVREALWRVTRWGIQYRGRQVGAALRRRSKVIAAKPGATAGSDYRGLTENPPGAGPRAGSELS